MNNVRQKRPIRYAPDEFRCVNSYFVFKGMGHGFFLNRKRYMTMPKNMF